MYILGAHIIATYSGKPFTEFVKERIFDPLGMTSTTYSTRVAERSGNLSDSFVVYGGAIRRTPFWLEDESISSLVAGPGGIISNTVDIVRFVISLLNATS